MVNGYRNEWVDREMCDKANAGGAGCSIKVRAHGGLLSNSLCFCKSNPISFKVCLEPSEVHETLFNTLYYLGLFLL